MSDNQTVTPDGWSFEPASESLLIQLEASHEGEDSRRDGKEEFARIVMKDVDAPVGNATEGGGWLHACIIVHVIRYICLSELVV